MYELNKIQQNYSQPISKAEVGSQTKELHSQKKKRLKLNEYNVKFGLRRALTDPRPLHIPDGLLSATLKELVGQIHGDYGRASVATGTSLAIILWLF